MKSNQISTAFIVSGVTMLSVHQFTVQVVANKVEDALIQYNILDALVGILSVSLVLIAIGTITTAVGMAKKHAMKKK